MPGWNSVQGSAHKCLCSWSQVLLISHCPSRTEPPPAPALRDPGLLSAASALLLSQKWGVPMQKKPDRNIHTVNSQETQRQSKLQQGGGKKKDQVFLSEQQLSSCTWRPAAIFNKMLLFNIVYCQQPMVIFSWTMHTQASKSLSLSLKLGRIFSRTPQWHYLTPPSHSSVITATSPEICSQEFGDTATQNSLYSWVFLTEKVICTNKSLICILRNPSIKPRKGQWI